MSHDALTISRLSGRDMSISSELLRATKPLDADISALSLLRREFKPKPSVTREVVAHDRREDATYVNLEEDAEYLRTNPSAFLYDESNAAHLNDKVIEYSEAERAALLEGQDSLTAELRTMYMKLSANVVSASDRASAEFVAIMRDVFGFEGVKVDDTLHHMSSVVLDLESLALLLGKSQHIPAETKAALLQHASTQLYDSMVLSRKREASAKRWRDDIQRAMRPSNSGLAVRPEDVPE